MYIDTWLIVGQGLGGVQHGTCVKLATPRSGAYRHSGFGVRPTENQMEKKLDNEMKTEIVL